MKEINLDKYTPAISVIVPVYNGEKFIGQCLDSLAKQKCEDFEIVVIDDGSTDGTKAMVDKFSYFRNLRYYYKENGGTGSALNLGHKRAVGNYITWCSADNVYFSNFLSVLSAALDECAVRSQKIELMYSDFCFMNEAGQKIADQLHDKPQSGADLVHGYDIGMCFMYTRALWEKTGPYWNRICEDFNWCVRAAQHTNFGLVKALLGAFRVHSGQITGSRKEEEKKAADDCKALAVELFG